MQPHRAVGIEEGSRHAAVVAGTHHFAASIAVDVNQRDRVVAADLAAAIAVFIHYESAEGAVAAPQLHPQAPVARIQILAHQVGTPVTVNVAQVHLPARVVVPARPAVGSRLKHHHLMQRRRA